MPGSEHAASILRLVERRGEPLTLLRKTRGPYAGATRNYPSAVDDPPVGFTGYIKPERSRGADGVIVDELVLYTIPAVGLRANDWVGRYPVGQSGTDYEIAGDPLLHRVGGVDALVEARLGGVG